MKIVKEIMFKSFKRRKKYSKPHKYEIFHRYNEESVLFVVRFTNLFYQLFMHLVMYVLIIKFIIEMSSLLLYDYNK